MQIIHTEFADGFFGSRAALPEYVLTPADDPCMDLAPPPISDRRAREILTDRPKIHSGIQLQTYEKAERDRSLRILKQRGLPVRQAGINRGVLTRA